MCRPDSEVRVALDAATPVTVTTGAEGQFLAELKILADTPLGQHTLTAICTEATARS
jgi:hypothetical protein